MTVSVIIRTHNRPWFLRRALSDIAAQTTPPDEVIVVNDGGESAAVETSTAESPLQIRVITNETKLGRAAAANVGIRAASSDLITMHDDDDTWAPTFLEKTTTWLAKNPESPAVVTKIDIIEESVTDAGVVTVTRQYAFQPQLHEVTLFDLLHTNRFTPIGFVYRKELHDELGAFDTSLPVVEDWDWHMRIAARGPIPVIQTDSALAFWRQRPTSTGSAGNSVVVEADDHGRYDLLRRDEALRNDPSGIGGLLYVTRYLDDRFRETHEHLDRAQGEVRELHARVEHLEKAIRDTSVIEFARHKWERLRRRH
ncbi:glycosyltransferase family 2 protein [Pseudoclavibacter sp. CFCC 14310]|uniref:glycosyltransferase family 2 protein n=1 Tax=Pseudoclavibacter sp. CFCC 14310 TaxID=2615180 RepID=UPI00130175AB|nr:glycosyltransferase family 2 protein [Pseudoclavibacter sp. CFCC 14310]KAB1647054.1 glycosyltransferase family 2 protein [Pseudoclavibacter sp. CFCC 14310]